MVISCTALINEVDNGCFFSQLILILMAIVGFVFAISVKQDLKRYKFEEAKKNKLSVDSNTILSC